MPLHPVSRKGAGRSGFVLLTSAVSMIVVIGFLGLAMDVGYLQVMRMRAQVAADAGALAAGHEILNGNTSQITTSGCNDASLNGFTNGVNGVTITVNRPPASGAHTGDDKYAEVNVAKDQPTFFMRLFGINSVNVKARALGRPGSSPTCLYVLDPTANEALKDASDANVQLACGILVNSNNTDKALYVSGHACLTASAIGVVGDFKNDSDCATGITPTPTTGIETFTDPLASLTRPAVGAGNYTDYKLDKQTVTMNPGVYCRGIYINESIVTMNPGL